MRSLRHVLLVWIAWAAGAAVVQGQDPFSVEADLRRGPPAVLTVTFRVPADHYLYGHMLAVEVLRPESAQLVPVSSPSPKTKYDAVLEKDVSVYDADSVFSYRVEGLGDAELTVAVSYQGCTEAMCFLPQRRELTPGGSAGAQPAASLAEVGTPAGRAGDWRGLAEQFEIAATGNGYMPPEAFLRFLGQEGASATAEANLLQRVFRRYGLFVALLLVIPLGMLLNLTPCVLPMIPVNLAIIGAGQAGGGRYTGLTRGAVYGAGMALVYGLLGVVVVLTGSRFGALNASPWFNLAVALIFVVLGLAMFDVIVVDLSRFQRGGIPDGHSPRSPLIAAFVLGGTAALLAGACVAPVLIWVLVLATDLYVKGNPAGLLLPLMLGVGMALPWPVVGAGLSVLPRPGNWMNRIKYAFGALILGFAVYYAVLGVRLFVAQHAVGPRTASLAPDGWNPSLPAGLQQALDHRQPAILDFWALTCKSCMKMKKTTFKDADVVAALEPYVRIAVQTDDVNDPLVRAALDYYKVLGLPTYVVLRPRQR